jgi:hypothetical protein
MAGQDGLSANLTLGLLLDCRLSPLLAPHQENAPTIQRSFLGDAP